MASKSYTLLEYLVTLETELKKLKKIVAESVGADFSELIAQINGIGNELNSFKSSITDTVNTNNSEITSKFNSLEQQFNTFKTSITNTVNSNNTTLTSQLSTLTTQFSQFKTTLESQVSGLTTRMTNVENRVTTLENSCGSGGSGGNANIDDTTISKISTWSSEKIEDFVHTNDDVVWSTVQGENLSIEYTKEGYFREVEIWGNTLQNEINLEDTRHLGQLYVDESGQPILDGEGREQYKIEIESRNFYNEEELLSIKPKTHKTTILLPCQLCKAGDVADRLFWDNEKGKYVVEKNLNQTVTFNGSEDWTLNWGSSDNYIGFNLEGYISDFKRYSMNYLNNKILTKTEYSSLTTKDFEWISLHPSRIAFKVAKNRLSTPDLEGIKAWVKDLYVIYELDTPQLIETTILEEIKQPTYKDLTHFFVTGNLDGTIKAKAPLDGGQAIQTLSAKNVALNEEVITLSLENEEIKEVNNTQDILIDTTMLATDEIFTMIEPILDVVPQNISLEKGVSKMVDMYVCMIQRGLKTIEQIPIRYREEVRRILEELEK